MDRAGDGDRLPLPAGEAGDRRRAATAGAASCGRASPRAACSIASSLMKPSRSVSSRPRKRLATASRFSDERQVLVDRLDAERLGVARSSGSSTGAPSTRISPASAGSTPERILISVDLPAPLWPSSPSTSPAARSRLTSSTAWTPPKVLVMPRSSTSGRGGHVAPLPAIGHVDPDREDQHHRQHHLLQRRRHAHQDHAAFEALHDRRRRRCRHRSCRCRRRARCRRSPRRR